MVLPRINQVREERAFVSSEDVIDLYSRGVTDAMEIQDLSETAPATSESVLPGTMDLNEPGGVLAIRILESAANSAFDEVMKPKPLASIPTADLISHTSFKVGSKFVIRIVPSPDAKSRDASAQQQVIADSNLYFDRASLQATSEISEERYQIFEGFDAETVFLFGERPKIWNFQFQVLNGARPPVPTSLEVPGAEAARDEFVRRWNMDFCDELVRRYDRYYRGTQALRLRARVFMSYEDTVLEATLVALMVAKNQMVTAAANVGITFIVHERTFLGEDLVFGADQTLAELLQSQDRNALLTASISPTSIIPPKKTPSQLLALYAENQEATAASQSVAEGIQQQQSSADSALADAKARRNVLGDQVTQLQAQIDASIDPAERASLKQQLARTQADYDKALSDVDAAFAASENASTDLAKATAENEANLQTQQNLEAQLHANPDGDLVEGGQEIITVVEVIEVDGDTKTSTTYEVTSEEDADLIVAGVIPATAVLLDLVDVSADPSYAERTAGSEVRQEVSHQ